MAKMIDLASKSEAKPSNPSDKYYPTLHISGINLPMGEFTATISGCVNTNRDNDGSKSCDIEVYEMSQPEFEGGLSGALDKIKASKSKDPNEDDEEYD
jgi:hypothetical protein